MYRQSGSAFSVTSFKALSTSLQSLGFQENQLASYRGRSKLDSKTAHQLLARFIGHNIEVNNIHLHLY